MWLNIVESGQFLNSEMVERFSVDQGEDTFLLNAHMPSGETVAVSRHPTFGEGTEALRELILSFAPASE